MEPMPDGSRELVDQAIEEGAQSLFTVAGVTLARKDELLRLIQGPAVRAALEARIEQVVKHGHTPEGDLALPLPLLADQARRMLAAALDVVPKGDRRNLSVAKLRLARTAALCFAVFDRIEAEERLELEQGRE